MSTTRATQTPAAASPTTGAAWLSADRKILDYAHRRARLDLHAPTRPSGVSSTASTSVPSPVRLGHGVSLPGKDLAVLAAWAVLGLAAAARTFRGE